MPVAVVVAVNVSTLHGKDDDDDGEGNDNDNGDNVSTALVVRFPKIAEQHELLNRLTTGHITQRAPTF